MFNNELMADVHFVVGQPGRTQRLPGHRVRILASSEVALKGWKMNKQAATQAGPLLLISYKLEKKHLSSLPAIMKLIPFVLHHHFRTMCLFETVLNYLCKWGWRMEAQSERRRKGYPLQRSFRAGWSVFVSALAQLFMKMLCNYSTFNQTPPTTHRNDDQTQREARPCARLAPCTNFCTPLGLTWQCNF